jgi:hypothetical protein
MELSRLELGGPDLKSIKILWFDLN